MSPTMRSGASAKYVPLKPWPLLAVESVMLAGRISFLEIEFAAASGTRPCAALATTRRAALMTASLEEVRCLPPPATEEAGVATW